MNPLTRREAARAILSAALGSMLPVSSARTGAPTARFESTRLHFGPARETILAAIKADRATGVAIAVVDCGKMVWAEGFGWSDREAVVPATAHTPFTLASLTKPFTAAAFMTLVNEGKLSLDAQANTYLGKNKLRFGDGEKSTATIRELGAHVSGLPSMFEQCVVEGCATRDEEDVLSRYGRLAYPPGSYYEYSNIGFAALGTISSDLTGMDFGAFLHRRLLGPLGLTGSFFDTDLARLKSGAARYDSCGARIPYYTTSTPASGELFASAHDLARFAVFNMSRKRVTALDKSMEEIHRPVFTSTSGVATSFGWFTSHLRSGASVIFKIGGQPGAANALYMVPSRGLACIFLSNRSDGRELCSAVCNQILGQNVPDWRTPDEALSPAPSSFVASPCLEGVWQGALANGGAKARVRLFLSSNSAALQIDHAAPLQIRELALEGDAFTGTAEGSIDSPEVRRAGATTLRIKLVPYRRKLTGRILATDSKSIVLPYVLHLSRITD